MGKRKVGRKWYRVFDWGGKMGEILVGSMSFLPRSTIWSWFWSLPNLGRKWRRWGGFDKNYPSALSHPSTHPSTLAVLVFFFFNLNSRLFFLNFYLSIYNRGMRVNLYKIYFLSSHFSSQFHSSPPTIFYPLLFHPPNQTKSKTQKDKYKPTRKFF